MELTENPRKVVPVDEIDNDVTDQRHVFEENRPDNADDEGDQNEVVDLGNIGKGWNFEEFLVFLKNSLSYDNIKSTVRWLIEKAKIDFSISFDDIMMTLTLFVLFATDIAQLNGPKNADDGIIVLYSIALFFFIAEFFIASWVQSTIHSFWPFKYEGYIFGFYFWLDAVATFSLLPDIPWIADKIGLSGNGGTGGARVIRMVRLVRLVKVYKIAQEKKKNAKIERELNKLVMSGAITMAAVEQRRKLFQTRQSRLGTQLSETITQRVIMLVLIMLIVVPLLTQTSSDNAPLKLTEDLQDFNIKASGPILSSAIDWYVQNYNERDGRPFLLKLDVEPQGYHYVTNYTAYYNGLRDSSIETFYFGNGTHSTCAYFNKDLFQRTTSELQIILTIFVAVMLISGSVVVNDDVQLLVLTPVERMMNLVDTIAKDPLRPLVFNTGAEAQYETKMVADTITKITGLLRVGFGEAGAGIIAANLDMQDTSGKILDPLKSGLRVYCIVGFCDIHKFDDINQKLTKDVLIFVNTIAAVVHGCIQDWGGQSNKNLGNAFVLIWRIGEEDDIISMTTGIDKSQITEKRRSAPIDLRRVAGVDNLADKALVGYLKIIAELNRNEKILSYRTEPRLTGNGEHEFIVRMGFGLHAGWAIEGAVGSLQKIDATYLSPHVNMAARLETSSRQYGVPVLVSQSVFDLFSTAVQQYCRKLDVVTVKGSEFPIGIYTYDCLQNQTFVDRSITSTRLSMVSSKSRPSINNGVDAELVNEVVFKSAADDAIDVFLEDIDLRMLRSHITPEFKSLFEKGINTYLAGDWAKARDNLEECDKMMRNVSGLDGDGPSKTLLSYMEERNWTAPADWAGFRPLTSK